MSNPGLVSIIIPTFNRAVLIGETLDSIIAQTYTNWECIVVDDGSTDLTAEIMQQYTKRDQRITYHQRPPNYAAGGNGARNYGLDLAKGEYISWLDSDDIMLPKKIELQVCELQQTETCINIAATYQFVGDIDNIIKDQPINMPEDFFGAYLRREITILIEAPLFRKDIFKKNGIKLFDESLRAAQEWEFFCRIFYLIDRTKISITNIRTVAIRIHDTSMTKLKSHETLYNYYLARQKVRSFLSKKGDRYYEDYFSDYNKIYFEFLHRTKSTSLINIFFKNEKEKFFNGHTLLNPYMYKLFLLTGKGKGKINFRYYEK